jgi:hypothetical protein
VQNPKLSDKTKSNRKPMKLKEIIIVIGCAAGIFTLQLANAQGVVTFVDNTGQTVAGNNAVGQPGAGPRVDVEFQTGPNALGYTLDSVSILMASAGNNTFAAQLGILGPDDATGLFTPISLLGSDAPVNAGLYTIPVPQVTLAPNTDYWLMLLNKGIGSFQWSYTSTTAGITEDGWSITGNTGPVGSSPVGVPIFAVSATPVPEPSPTAFLAIGVLALLGRTRLVRDLAEYFA